MAIIINLILLIIAMFLHVYKIIPIFPVVLLALSIGILVGMKQKVEST